MKRLIILMLCIILTVSFAACGNDTVSNESSEGIASEETQQENITEDSSTSEKPAIQLVDDGTISFRGIPWHTNLSDTEKQLKSESAEVNGYNESSDIYRLSGTDYTNVTLGRDRVDEGGFRKSYTNLEVAGYTPSGTYACFMFRMSEGKLNKEESEADFYMGWYEFENDDYEKIRALYEDLIEKLNAVYGDSAEVKTDKYHTYTLWKDQNNNIVRILMDNDETYVTLTYMAANADADLDKVQELVANEKGETEDLEREENKDNNSGL